MASTTDDALPTFAQWLRGGGPEWRRALAIMAQVAARSTDAVVAADFGAMVRELAG